MGNGKIKQRKRATGKLGNGKYGNQPSKLRLEDQITYLFIYIAQALYQIWSC